MNDFISVTDARKKLFQIIDDVNLVEKHYTLTEKGIPKAIIMSIEEYESLVETIELFEEDPNILKRIKKAEEEFKRGEHVTLDEVMENLGYTNKNGSIFRDKSKKTYSTKRKKK